MCVCIYTCVFQDVVYQCFRAEGVGRGEEAGQSVSAHLSHLCLCEAAYAVLQYMHVWVNICTEVQYVVCRYMRLRQVYELWQRVSVCMG